MLRWIAFILAWRWVIGSVIAIVMICVGVALPLMGRFVWCRLLRFTRMGRWRFFLTNLFRLTPTTCGTTANFTTAGTFPVPLVGNGLSRFLVKLLQTAAETEAKDNIRAKWEYGHKKSSTGYPHHPSISIVLTYQWPQNFLRQRLFFYNQGRMNINTANNDWITIQVPGHSTLIRMALQRHPSICLLNASDLVQVGCTISECSEITATFTLSKKKRRRTQSTMSCSLTIVEHRLRPDSIRLFKCCLFLLDDSLILLYFSPSFRPFQSPLPHHHHPRHCHRRPQDLATLQSEKKGVAYKRHETIILMSDVQSNPIHSSVVLLRLDHTLQV